MSGQAALSSRPGVSGKFLHVDGHRFLVKGVSYGTFAPGPDGALFPDPATVAYDFAAMSELGANTVRTYTPPSRALLDEAARHGLRVIVGLPWPQHIAFLDSATTARDIRATVSAHVRDLAAHPATLLFTLGNEIPPGIVRWYGRRRIERFLRELYDEAKSAAPEALAAYINYPPTEYLDTSGFDVCAFNVFLHGEAELGAYLARLHHIAGARPLLVAEAGADSLRHGEEHQASLVAMQLRTAYQQGAAGAIAFSWTDDWWRGGRVVDDWRFGLVDAERRPKRAFAAVQRVFAETPFGGASDVERASGANASAPTHWPRVSVVVCAYNAADTLDECLTSLEALRYPDAEILIVNDGSKDATGEIAERHASRHPHLRVIHTANGGLAAARNIGLAEAAGEIVAYTDADVRVDPDWLAYLVQPFISSDVAAAGGPNIVPPDDSWIAQCVARAPGGPTHVLLDDRVAEHIPGCNCAFRRDALLAIGGFNPIFLRAGDDVDVCWRLQARGWEIGFAPAALVWHRHRGSVRAYLRQQMGYGEGETWLMREHPDKFAGGRITWRGHIYSPLPFIRSLSATRIHAGPFGSAPFPSVYRTDAHPFAYIAHTGRWQIAWTFLALLAIPLTYVHQPLGPVLFAIALVAMLSTGVKCLLYGLRSDVATLPAHGALSARASHRLYRLTIAALHFLQPFARLYGRLRGAVTRPPGQRDRRAAQPPIARAALATGLRLAFRREIEMTFWSERWVDVRDLLAAVADRLRRQRAVRDIELDSGWWEDRDLTIGNRAWCRVDLRALVEEHADGKCLCRFRLRARITPGPWPLLLVGAVGLLDVTGLVPWTLAALIACVIFTLVALGDMVVVASTVAAAVDRVGDDFGLLPLGSHTQPRPPKRAPAEGAGMVVSPPYVPRDERTRLPRPGRQGASA